MSPYPAACSSLQVASKKGQQDLFAEGFGDVVDATRFSLVSASRAGDHDPTDDGDRVDQHPGHAPAFAGVE